MFLLTPQQITILSLIPTFFFVFAVILEIISGARRGLSKSIKLFITFLISIIICVIFFIIVSKKDYDYYLCHDGLKQIQNMNPGFSWKEIFKTTSDHDRITEYLAENLSNNDIFKNSTQGMTAIEAAKLLYNLSLIALNVCLVLVCFVLFFICKFVLYIFYLIFFREGRRKKRINKKYSEGKVDKPYQPHRFLGSLVGALRGVIVATFFASCVGVLSLITTKSSTETPTNTEYVEDKNKAYVDFYQIIEGYNTNGIGKVLGSVKNKENVPLYLFVWDKLYTCDYEYVDEDGNKQTIKLKIGKDLASYTSTTSKIAYLFVLYGFDFSKASDTADQTEKTNYFTEFITSDKQIDGKTLEERIGDELSSISSDSFAVVLDSFMRAFVSSYTDGYNHKDTTKDASNLDLSKRVLYQLFLGDYALKTSDVLNGGNAKVVFNLFCDILNNKDEFDKLKSIMNKTDDTTSNLSLSVNKSYARTLSARSKHIFSFIKEDLQNISFYGDTKFNKLLSTIVIEIVKTQYPNFDLNPVPNVNGEDFLNINWTKDDSTQKNGTIDILFDFLDYIVSKALDNESIKSYSDLIDYFINDMSDSNSETVNELTKIIDSSAGSVFLNTLGFKKLINDKVNEMFKEQVKDGITLVDTNYGTYEDENGITHVGELAKIFRSVCPTISSIYRISKDESLETKDKTTELLNVLTNPTSSIYDLIDVSKDNHSDLVHALLSDFILATNYKLNDKDFSFYYKGYTDIVSEHEVIKSNDFIVLLKVLNKVTTSFVKLTSEPLDTSGYINILNEITDDSLTELKQCDLFTANMSLIIYELSKSKVNIPHGYSLEEESIDLNISNWTGVNGEMSNLLDIIKGLKDLIVKIANGENEKNYLAQIANLSSDELNSLIKSKLVNSTVTNKLSDTQALFVPTVAYANEYKDLLKDDEIKSMVKFVKTIFNISTNDQEVDLNTIDSDVNYSIYNDNPNLLLEALEGNIASATVSNLIVKNNNNGIYVAPDYMFTKEDETNLSKWFVVKNEDVYNGELANIINALANLRLMNVIKDNSALTEDVLLHDSLDINKVLLSDTIWLTLSKKLIDSSSLIIPLSVIDNSRTVDTYNYIYKNEIESFVSSIKKVFTTTTISSGVVDAASVLANATSDSFFNSKIIRSIVTDKIISEGNDISISRHPINDADTVTTYATRERNIKTQAELYVLSIQELNRFVTAVNYFVDTNSFAINYSAITLNNLPSINVLDSSVILTGLYNNTSSRQNITYGVSAYIVASGNAIEPYSDYKYVVCDRTDIDITNDNAILYSSEVLKTVAQYSQSH